MTQLTPRFLKATIVACLTMVCCTTAIANNDNPVRRGKVVIIRGAFTVFSLGMNDLGERLREYGYDVDVVADISASRATSKIISDFQRNPNYGPIVFIGHSRGAELGPKQARTLQQYGIPVKLVVMVDGTHKASIPANVERCVNLFHYNSFGVLHGVPTRAEGRNTQLLNVDINQLQSRHRGGMINHFNIDSSDWIHELVVSEVLKVCPIGGTSSQPAMASRASTPQQPIRTVNYSKTHQPTRAAAYPYPQSQRSYPYQQPRSREIVTRPACCCRQSWIRISD